MTTTDNTISAPSMYEVDEYDLDGVTPMTWRGMSTDARAWRITPILDANGGTVFDIRISGDEADGLLSREAALSLAMALIAEATIADAAHAQRSEQEATPCAVTPAALATVGA